MTHPIIPPPELVQKWGNACPYDLDMGNWGYEQFIAEQAAQWAADQEIEACCAIALTDPVCGTKFQRRQLVSHILEKRRPKPPTLKEEAMRALYEIESIGSSFVNNRTDALRRALEQLDD